eukprot:scaffold180311_cov15-Tisochrysis_lutea.AAC.1
MSGLKASVAWVGHTQFQASQAAGTQALNEDSKRDIIVITIAPSHKISTVAPCCSCNPAAK